MGGNCSAVTNASDIASLASYRGSGPADVSGSPSSRSGHGKPEHLADPRRLRRLDACGRVIAGRRLADRRMFRQRVVAIRYIQVRTEARPLELLQG